jgi:uncharacterized protein
MRYRRFGKTNLNLSVFSLGTMRYLASQENARQTIEKALSLGINHFETARGYGKSEEYLGAALAQDLPVPRSQIYITTKISPTSDADSMRRCIDESLERLQSDYVDCLAIHGINTWEHLKLVQDDGCMQAVQTAVKDGRVKHVGFSSHGSLELISTAIASNLFEFVSLHYYYFHQRNAAALELAKANNLGIFIISPADKGGRLYTPPQTLIDLCYPFTPLELNYRFLLSDPGITTLSVGAAQAEELIEPLKFSDRDWPLTADELAAYQRLAAQLTSIGSQKCSQCYACLPCPENINIPEILRLRNLAVAYDMIDYGNYRYTMLENAGHWFPGNKGNHCTNCGDCLPRCPEKLDIPALLADAHQQLNGSSRRRLWE